MKKGAQFKFKTKGVKVQTARGVGQFVYVDKPNTRFAEEGEAGHFESTILLPQDAAQLIIEPFEKLLAAAVAEVEEAKGKKVKVSDAPYRIDDKTGLVAFKFKKPAESNIEGKKVKNHVAVVDAKAALIPQGKIPKIGSGSTIKINGFLSPFFVPAVGVGVSLKLRGLQIVKLVEYSSGDDTNFASEDDGYEFTAEGTEDQPATAAGADAAGGDDAAGEAASETPDF